METNGNFCILNNVSNPIFQNIYLPSGREERTQFFLVMEV